MSDAKRWPLHIHTHSYIHVCACAAPTYAPIHVHLQKHGQDLKRPWLNFQYVFLKIAYSYRGYDETKRIRILET